MQAFRASSRWMILAHRPAGRRPPWRSRPSWFFSVQMTASTRWRSQFGNGRGCFSSLRAGRIRVRPRSGPASRAGISASSVLRIWRAFGLQPWRTETFKISPDPLLIDKVRDVVGLYLAPPASAAVFAVDENPQIQALERTAPVLPMIPGVPGRRSFDYVRHGTIDLFAALTTATGKVIGKLSAQHRAIDFRDFLDEIDRQTEPSLAIHVICDNLSAHKAPAVHKWLLAHPRVQLHFIPTYSSWISQVERWFAELQRRCLDRGGFCSLD